MAQSAPQPTLLQQLDTLEALYEQHAGQLTATGLRRFEMLQNFPGFHTEADLQTVLLELHALIRPGQSFVAHLLEASPELRRAAEAELTALEQLRDHIGEAFAECARKSGVAEDPARLRSFSDRVLSAYMKGPRTR